MLGQATFQTVHTGAYFLTFTKLQLIDPLRVAQLRSADAGEVDFTILNQVGNRLGIVKLAYGGYRNRADLFRDSGHIKPRCVRFPLRLSALIGLGVKAARDVQHVRTGSFAPFGVLCPECFVDAAGNKVDCCQAYRENERSRKRGAHFLQHLLQQPETIFVTAAVFICTMVGDRREEVVEQIHVAGMEFHAVKATFRSGACVGKKCCFQLLDLFTSDLSGAVEFAGADRLLTLIDGRVCEYARVIELCEDLRAEGVDSLRDLLPVGIVLDSVEGQRRDVLLLMRIEHINGFHDHQSRSALGAFAVVGEQLAGRGSVQIAEAGGHGGEHNAVFDFRTADGDRLKQCSDVTHNVILLVD